MFILLYQIAACGRKCVFLEVMLILFFVGIVLLLWCCLGCSQSSLVSNTKDGLDYQERQWNAKTTAENRGKNKSKYIKHTSTIHGFQHMVLIHYLIQ